MSEHPMKIVSVGITASRDGISTQQETALAIALAQARRRGAVQFHHGDCFTGDTRFLTDQGVKTLREVCGEHVKVLGGGNRQGLGWAEAIVKDFGVQPTWRLRLSRRGREKVLHTTEGHRWFVRKHHSYSGAFERVTRDLQPGDRLLGRYGRLQTNVRPSPFGIAHGITFGDGTRPRTQQPATLDLYGTKNEVLLRYFSASATTPTKGGVRVWDLPRYFKDAPLLTESKSYLYGWLAGYFAADGNVSTSGDVTLSSARRDHLAVVEDICAVLGLSVYPVRMTMRTGLGSQPTPLYTLPFHVGSLREDFILIEEHRRRFLAMPRIDRRPIDWTVRSVEPTGCEEEVYCAVVPDGEAFTLEHNILTGNCLGGDAVAAHLARALGYWIVAHPPTSQALRAYFPSDEYRAPLDYLARDRAIVAEIDLLVGLPFHDRWQPRSGTWYTIGQARLQDRPRLVVAPDGRLLDTWGLLDLAIDPDIFVRPENRAAAVSHDSWRVDR